MRKQESCEKWCNVVTPRIDDESGESGFACIMEKNCLPLHCVKLPIDINNINNI